MRQILSRLIRATGGNVGVEFAVALPVLVTLTFGTFEVSRYVYLNLKLSRTASTAADLVARAQTVSESDIDQVFLAAGEVAKPFELGSDAVVIISSVTREIGEAPTIAWQRSGAGSLATTSQLGAEGDTPALGDEFTVAEGETVIVTEAYFDYEPTLRESLLASKTLYSRSFSRARKSSLSSIDAG